MSPDPLTVDEGLEQINSLLRIDSYSNDRIREILRQVRQGGFSAAMRENFS